MSTIATISNYNEVLRCTHFAKPSACSKCTYVPFSATAECLCASDPFLTTGCMCSVFQQRDAYVRMFRLKGCQCNADCMEACDTVRMSLPLLFVTAAWSCVCTLFHLLLLCVSIADGFALLFEQFSTNVTSLLNIWFFRLQTF